MTVWLAVTVAAVAAGRAVPTAWRDVRAGAPVGDAVTEAIVAGCATVLAVALGWLWLVTSTTVVHVLAGSVPTGGGAVRRLVLLACGAAVAAGTTVPAHADARDGDDRRDVEQLAGLSLPERAVAPAARSPRTHPGAVTVARHNTGGGETYVVQPGDSLWSIAQAHPGDGETVELRWRAIWTANRDVVGADPDLIHPGQALRLPGTYPDEDGER